MGRLILPLLWVFSLQGSPAPVDRPFDFWLDDTDRAAYEQCVGPSDGVAGTWRLPKSFPSGRVDLFEEEKGFPRWRWRGCAPVRDGAATLRASAGSRIIAIARSPGRDPYLFEGPFLWPGDSNSLRFGDGTVVPLRGAGTFPAGELSAALITGSDGDGFDPLCESDGARWQCVAVPRGYVGVIALCPAGGEGRHVLVAPDMGAEVALEPAVGTLPVILESEWEPPREPLFRLVQPQKHGYRAIPGLTVRRLAGSSFWVSAKDAPPEAILEISAAGKATRRLALQPLASSARCGEMAVVALDAAVEIAGRVLDSDGAPLAGTSLVHREPGAAEKPRADGSLAPGGRILGETHADESGAFRIGSLEERPYLVRACHPSRRCQERLLRPPFDPIEIRFDRSGIVRGRILSAAGAPEPSARIQISPNRATAEQAEDMIRLVTEPANADAEGRFEIAVQAAGQFNLEATAPLGGGAARREVTVSSTSALSSSIDLGDIRLSVGGSFRARVPGCADGELFFVGPMGGEVLAQMKQFRLDPNGQTVVDLPGGGEWLTGAKCAGAQAYLKPASLPRVEDLWDLEIVFEIDRDREGESP